MSSATAIADGRTKQTLCETTLYELVATVAESAPGTDDHLVSRVVAHMLSSRRAKFIHRDPDTRPEITFRLNFPGS